MSSANSLETLVVIVSLIISSVMLLLGVQAFLAERDAGLAPRRNRLVGTILLTVSVWVLCALSFVAPSSPSPSDRAAPGRTPRSGSARSRAVSGEVPAPTPDAKIEQLQKELQQIEQQIRQLAEKRDQIAIQLKPAAGPQPAPAESPPAASPGAGDEAATPNPAGTLTPELPGWQLLVAGLSLCLTLSVVLFVLLSSDPRTLKLPRWLNPVRGPAASREETARELNRLFLAVDRGDTRAGLEIAERLNGDLLDRMDWLDWCYLRHYCGVREAALGEASSDDAHRRALCQAAVAGIGSLLAVAPQRAEARYVLALAHAMLGQPDQAISEFRHAKSSLTIKDLPFDHNESVCLLQLAEKRLGEGNSVEAGRLFDDVTRLKVLAGQIPLTLVRIRLIEVRRALAENRFADAQAGIAALQQVQGLSAEHRNEVEAICGAVDVLVASGQNDDARAIARVDEFMQQNVKTELPPTRDEDADEFLESPLVNVPLTLPPTVFRMLLFLKACAQARQTAASGRRPSPGEVESLATPLLRALQFELRHPEVLAALGGLYAWFLPAKREKALQWLEAATNLGTKSALPARILRKLQERETWQKEVLGWFSPFATRLLTDPTLQETTRRALIEELARFDGHRPATIDFERLSAVRHQEPTLRVLRERCQYFDNLADQWRKRMKEPSQELDAVHVQYRQRITTLEELVHLIADAEQQMVREIGKSMEL